MNCMKSHFSVLYIYYQVVAHDFLEVILNTQILLTPKSHRMVPDLKLFSELFCMLVLSLS